MPLSWHSLNRDPRPTTRSFADEDDMLRFGKMMNKNFDRTKLAGLMKHVRCTMCNVCERRVSRQPNAPPSSSFRNTMFMEGMLQPATNACVSVCVRAALVAILFHALLLQMDLDQDGRVGKEEFIAYFAKMCKQFDDDEFDKRMDRYLQVPEDGATPAPSAAASS